MPFVWDEGISPLQTLLGMITGKEKIMPILQRNFLCLNEVPHAWLFEPANATSWLLVQSTSTWCAAASQHFCKLGPMVCNNESEKLHVGKVRIHWTKALSKSNSPEHHPGRWAFSGKASFCALQSPAMHNPDHGSTQCPCLFLLTAPSFLSVVGVSGCDVADMWVFFLRKL